MVWKDNFVDGEVLYGNELDSNYSTITDIFHAQHGMSVFNGCEITEQVTPDQTAQMSSGLVLIKGVKYSISSNSSISFTDADATNPRYDLVSVDKEGNVNVTDGTPLATPLIPTLPADEVALAYVLRSANDNVINAVDITDCRHIFGVNYIQSIMSRVESQSSNYLARTVIVPAFVMHKRIKITYDFCAKTDDSALGNYNTVFNSKLGVNGIDLPSESIKVFSNSSNDTFSSESRTIVFNFDSTDYDFTQEIVLTLRLDGLNSTTVARGTSYLFEVEGY